MSLLVYGPLLVHFCAWWSSSTCVMLYYYSRFLSTNKRRRRHLRMLKCVKWAQPHAPFGGDL